MDLLRPLLIVYSSLLAINVVFSAYSICCNSDPLYRDLLCFWISTPSICARSVQYATRTDSVRFSI